MSLNAVKTLTLDDSLFDELEITLPGHKKRLRKAGTPKLCHVIVRLRRYIVKLERKNDQKRTLFNFRKKK